MPKAGSRHSSPFLTACFFLLSTLVGAGFASGREIMEFFIAQEIYGILSIILAGGGFLFISRRTLNRAKLYRANDIFSLLGQSLGNKTARFAGLLLFCFLTGFAALMITAIKAAVCIGMPAQADLMTGLIVIMTALVTLTGRSGFIRCTAFIAPALLFCLAVCASYSLYLHLFLWQDGISLIPTTAPPYSGCLSAGILYCFYNSASLITALIPLGAATDDYHSCQRGIAAGIFIFTIMAALLFITLLLHRPAAYEWPLPMLTVSASQFPLIFYLYALSFIIAAWSSFLSSFFNMGIYLQTAIGLNQKTALTALIITGFLFSRLEFSQLLNILAPLLSVSGIIIGLLLL